MPVSQRDFTEAIRNGSLEVLRGISRSEMKVLLSQGNYQAFRLAVSLNQLDVVNFFIDFARPRPNQIRNPLKTQKNRLLDMLRGNDFDAFKTAANEGHVAMIERLSNLAIEKHCLEEMIKADNYQALCIAASNGHLEVINQLIALEPSLERHHSITISNQMLAMRAALKSAVAKNHASVIQRLLKAPSVFYYALRQILCKPYLEPFIHAEIEALRVEKNHFNQDNPNRIFYLTPEQNTQFFTYIQHLVTVLTPENQSDLSFLLEFESLRNFARSIEISRQNMLLNLAAGNPVALAILIPILVRQNSAINGPSLSAIAANPENSMLRLSPYEEKQLLKARTHYQDQISVRGGSKQIIDDLKSNLESRYKLTPAKINIATEQEITLPFEDSAFKEMLKHNFSIKEDALRAYYEHPIHTAYRYFLAPNPWMSEDAQFVERDADHQGKSSFEQYQELIAILYLAAIDETIPAIDGWTNEGRIQHFFKEIAEINRAHNWDESRQNPNTDAIEHYDDLKGDKPSCSPGVLRRLFQSVQGHPLLTLLTKDMVHKEVIADVITHFKNSITPENCGALLAAWQEMINDPFNSDNINTLKQLDLSETKKQEIIDNISTRLSAKFGKDWDENGAFRLYMASTLTDSLATKLGGETNLLALLEQAHSSQPRELGRSLFEPKRKSDEQTNPSTPKNKK